jgi:dolichol-phosphate mannosyltransferase
VVVDDESTDATRNIAAEIARSEPRIRVLERHEQRGLAGAITYGWRQTHADFLGVIDADLQHPPELLPALLAEVSSGFDVAIASRYVRPHSMDEWNPLRRAVSRLSILVSSPVQKPQLKIKDPLSGFFVLRRKCISGISFQQNGFKLLLEILARGQVHSVIEIPFTFQPRQQGKSKANAMTAWHYLALLYRLCFEHSAQADAPNERSDGV